MLKIVEGDIEHQVRTNCFALFAEEEWKRYYESLSEGYKAVGFSYDYHGQPYGYTEEGRNICIYAVTMSLPLRATRL